MTRLDKLVAARRENVLAALRAIREQKLRSFLTCLGIIIGVGPVIVMVSLVEGFNRTFIAQVQACAGPQSKKKQRRKREREGRPPRRPSRGQKPAQSRWRQTSQGAGAQTIVQRSCEVLPVGKAPSRIGVERLLNHRIKAPGDPGVEKAWSVRRWLVELRQAIHRRQRRKGRA